MRRCLRLMVSVLWSACRLLCQRALCDLAHPGHGDRQDLVVEVVARIVELAAGAVADPDIGTWPFLDQAGEVVARGAWAKIAADTGADRLSGLGSKVSLRLCVDDRPAGRQDLD